MMDARLSTQFPKHQSREQAGQWRSSMHSIRLRPFFAVGCAALFAVLSHSAQAKVLCVKPAGKAPCYAKIQLAVNAAAAGDSIDVAAGTYKEDVIIGKQLSLIGAGAADTIIDATGLPNGIFVDGLDRPGLKGVSISGFTVENAQYEGVLVVSTTGAKIIEDHILNNDTIGPVFGSGPACNGQPAFETDESGDCGGGVHLIGSVNAIVEGNFVTGNADGILISDETAESHGNLIAGNNITDNPAECGVVLASHPPVGSSAPYFAPHYGVNKNTVTGNIVSKNGVTVGGAGVGLFSDGQGPGTVTGNSVLLNELTDNGIPGVSLHTHVGPAFGAPADNMDGNIIVGNLISGNGPDTDDTATPGPTGININSGGGGSPVTGTVISGNIITGEDIDIAVNTPATLSTHFNDLLGGKVGVANVCALDNASNLKVCTGAIDATENYWGCVAGPGAKNCSTTSGANIATAPWLKFPVL
jgi:parallel beta-helix repeat protein